MPRSRTATPPGAARASLPLALSLGLALAPGARAADPIGQAVTGYAASVLIRSQAPALDRVIDAVTLRHGLASRRATRVVPGFSVGRRTYVGAYQVVGAEADVSQVRCVFEVTGQVEGGKGRFARLIASSTSNPFQLRPVWGVGVSAALDASVWGPVGTFPVGGGDRGRLLRAAEAVAAAKLVGDELDKLLRRIEGIPSSVSTRVVPILTVGEKSYVGLAQVGGLGAAQVDAVLQVEENLGAKVRGRVMVPVDFRRGDARVDTVGVMGLVDMPLRKGTQAPSPEASPGGAPPPPVVVQPIPRSDPRPVVVVTPSGSGWDLSKSCQKRREKCYRYARACEYSGERCDKAEKACWKYEDKCGPGRRRGGPPPWAGRGKGKGKGHGRGHGRGRGRGHGHDDDDDDDDWDDDDD